MGLTFHYNGKFNQKASLSKMIDEVKDIADVNRWTYHIFEREFPPSDWNSENFDGKLYGMTFTPKKSEPVWLCFLSNGRISGPHNLQFYSNPANPEEKKYLYMVATKTQFAGREAHRKIIDLLKYLKDKYFEELNVYDEGQYWETGDQGLLDKIFGRFEAAFDIMDNALKTNSRRRNESYEAFFKRILKGKGFRRKE